MDAFFIGEIRLFGGNFTPRNWANCEGQLLPIANNTALFSILGTTYGGDGRTTFALPDLRSRTVIGEGRGPGLPDNRLGQAMGTPTNTLTVQQMASHSHSASVSGTVKIPTDENSATTTSPTDAYPSITNEDFYAKASSPGTSMGSVNLNGVTANIDNTGNNQPVNNHMPSLGLRYIIALYGLYPSRS